MCKKKCNLKDHCCHITDHKEAGRPLQGTALWVTSIGNEVGQILNSVLTVQERPGLDVMVSGVSVLDAYPRTRRNTGLVPL